MNRLQRIAIWMFLGLLFAPAHAMDQPSETDIMIQPIMATTMPPFPAENFDYSIRLRPGWNLVSVPVAFYQRVECITAPCPAGMPANIKSNTCRDPKVYAYDALNNRYRDQTQALYQEIYPQGGWSAGYAYWVKVKESCELTFEGSHRMTPELIANGDGWSLNAGWNAVGGPYKNVEFSKVSEMCRVSSGPYRFNTAANKWEKAQVLMEGEGYFIKVRDDCFLTPSGPVTTNREQALCESTGGKWIQYKCGTGNKCVGAKPYCECPSDSVWNDVKGCGLNYQDEAYCEKDSDCVRQGSCCDCGLGKYINKDHYEEVICEAQCLCASYPSRGICEDHQCKAVPKEYLRQTEKVEMKLSAFSHANNPIEIGVKNLGEESIYYTKGCTSPFTIEKMNLNGEWEPLKRYGPNTAFCMGFSVAELEPGNTDTLGTWNLKEYYHTMVNNDLYQFVGLGRYAIVFGYTFDPDRAGTADYAVRAEFSIP
ncbi:hypothetical protein KJ765_01130 [Candidatus Micrarchaeota archaeon]|nr:hypothetical protein [Candidatus Micrarchaeota archaeon]